MTVAKKHIAADTVLLGTGRPVQAGEEIPATYRDSLGNEQPTDFDRLKELGLLDDGK